MCGALCSLCLCVRLILGWGLGVNDKKSLCAQCVLFLCGYFSIPRMRKSLTFVPVFPVIIPPPIFCKKFDEE